jgi:ribosomal protein S18 acetylase RimI-like enzyme
MLEALPNNLAQTSLNLNDLDLSQKNREYLSNLEEKGYQVHLNLTENISSQIMTMAKEPDILEFCPNDAANRFKNMETTKAWLSKNRAMLTLMKKDKSDQLELAGYGWVGQESDPNVAHGATTWAVRIGGAYQGQKLATPFSALIVFATAQIYGLDNYWLATWASNPVAVHVYHKLGFVDVTEVQEIRKDLKGKDIDDKRLYMELPNEILS